MKKSLKIRLETLATTRPKCRKYDDRIFGPENEDFVYGFPKIKMIQIYPKMSWKCLIGYYISKKWCYVQKFEIQFLQIFSIFLVEKVEKIGTIGFLVKIYVYFN